MDSELPKRLYEEGAEPLGDKINKCARMSILTELAKNIESEYNEVKRLPLFAHIIAIHKNRLHFSAKMMHTLLTRQLITTKKHELWFVFARRPLRFSLQEFHAVTGLKCIDDGNCDLNTWVDDGGFWSRLLKNRGLISLETIRKKHVFEANKWTRVDRLRLVFVCLTALLMAVDEKTWLCHNYIKSSWTLTRCSNWTGAARAGFEDIIKLEKALVNQGVVYSYISSTRNMNVIDSQEFERKPVKTTPAPVVPSAGTNSEVVHNDGVESGEVFKTPCGEQTTSSGSRTRKRKVIDKGAEARKKRLLFERSIANAEQGSQSFMRGLLEDYEKRLTKQSDEKYEKFVCLMYCRMMLVVITLCV
ncbi:unnamed protein product [Microthlaspi erraticum]|uniref:DUF1985 domain-containing protein n=1 Tax=Microthlaspi erraticum TaxID=1685480 RepID=A0A6D2IT91_9BRAS|nr:unnamed protein product [Microthlaspi erraticum]